MGFKIESNQPTVLNWATDSRLSFRHYGGIILQHPMNRLDETATDNSGAGWIPTDH